MKKAKRLEAWKMKATQVHKSKLEESNNYKRRMVTIPIRWQCLMAIFLVALTLLPHQTFALTSELVEGSEVTSGAGDKSQEPLSSLDKKHEPELGQASADPQQVAGGVTNRKSDASTRNARQYDGPLSTSSTGNYAALSGDSGAYVGGSGMPSLNAGYGSAGASAGGISAYAGDPMGSNMYSSSAGAGPYHDQFSLAGRAAAGYPGMHNAGGYQQAMQSLPPGSFGGGAGGPLSGMFSGAGGGLLSSSGFPLMAKGFDLAEIVCTAVAVAIGAVIVGAPFILLYLFVMNQMQGNGPSAIGPSGGAISLTGPSSSTTVTGRKKRHTSLSEALFRQLSPLVNTEQVAQTFKVLMNSLAKYEV